METKKEWYKMWWVWVIGVFLFVGVVSEARTGDFLLDQSGNYTPIAFLLLYLTIGLLPTFIAFNRDHLQKIPILLVNLFLGWTIIGWIAALIWACTTPREINNIINNNISTSSNATITPAIDEKIRTLAKMKNEGLITNEEFEEKRKSLINSI